MYTKTDTHYMNLALKLAEKGRGSTSPNPMVGAVIVRDGEIIGKGYHRRFGSKHAEIIALQEAGKNARDATLYVTMEPCCHQGKTPPCTEAIVKSGINRVVTATIDINPVVHGNGIRILRNNNIETVIGVLEKQSQKLNEAYMKFIQTGLPFLTLKLAITLDGKTADMNRKSKWITGEKTRKRVHLLRSWSDAVMVGVGTVIADNPMLNVREVKGTSPLRVIIDSKVRTPLDALVLSDTHVIIAATTEVDEKKVTLLAEQGIEVWKFDSAHGCVPLSEVLKKLGKRNITSLFCEGGPTLAGSLLHEKLVDKIIFAVAPKILGKGYNAVESLDIEKLEDALYLNDTEYETIGDDILITGYPDYR